jgi:hypothetical protein
MPPNKQNKIIDLVKERQEVEKQTVLETLQLLKEQKLKSVPAFQRSAPQKLLSAFALKAGPPLPLKLFK